MSRLRATAADHEAALELLDVAERGGYAPYGAPTLVRFAPGPAIAGALLLTGRGAKIADDVYRSLIRPSDEGDQPLCELPLAAWRRSELLSLLWLAVAAAAADWRRLPTGLGPRLAGAAGAHERALRATLLAFADRDPSAVRRALRALAKIDDERQLLVRAVREQGIAEGLVAAARRR